MKRYIVTNRIKNGQVARQTIRDYHEQNPIYQGKEIIKDIRREYNIVEFDKDDNFVEHDYSLDIEDSEELTNLLIKKFGFRVYSEYGVYDCGHKHKTIESAIKCRSKLLQPTAQLRKDRMWVAKWHRSVIRLSNEDFHNDWIDLTN